jgi:hypothetical protein
VPKGSMLNMLPPPCFLGGGARAAGGGGARVGAGAGFAPPPPNKLSKGFAGFAGGAGAGAGASSFSQGHARTTVRRGCRAGANAVAVATMSASRMVFRSRACAQRSRREGGVLRANLSGRRESKRKPRDHVAIQRSRRWLKWNIEGVLTLELFYL